MLCRPKAAHFVPVLSIATLLVLPPPAVPRKHGNLCVQVVTFDVGALPEDASEETLTEAAVFRDTYLHLTSLLHATAFQSLCKDDDSRNFIMHNSLHQTPKEDAREEELCGTVHAQHMGMASWQDLFILRGRTTRLNPPLFLCSV